MSHPRTLLGYRLGALAGGMLLAAGVEAQLSSDWTPMTNTTPALAVTLQPGEVVGREQVIRELIRAGTSEFMFVVPAGLRTQTPGKDTIALISGEVNYCVLIRMVGSPRTDLGLKEALQEHIARRYSYVNSAEEFTAMVADREGCGLQVPPGVPSREARLARILWVPFKAGVLEFVLTADGASATAGQAALDAILLTFRSNERGPLEIVRRSDKS
jgi:hypothetical protein